MVAHDERGLAELVGLPVAPAVERVAIERPDGLVVEALLEAGIAVLAIHPHRASLRSPFRDPTGVVTAASLPAEIGDRRERHPDAGVLCAEAGVRPVAIASGRMRAGGPRLACDRRLRAALTTLADASRHRNPWAADLHRRARAQAGG